MGTESKNLEDYIEEIGAALRADHFQKTTLLGTTQMLQVLKTLRDIT